VTLFPYTTLFRSIVIPHGGENVIALEMVDALIKGRLAR
jgi:hypothetical protein